MHITGRRKLDKFAKRHSTIRRELEQWYELMEEGTFSESAYQWLVEVLDGLIEFGNRHGNFGVINLTEDEYEWLG